MKKTRYLPHFDSNKVVTGPYDSRKDNRFYVGLRDVISKKVKMQLFSRYLSEQHLGRYLNENEVIDHINRDKRDESILNYRIVSKYQNSLDDARRAYKVEITCQNCFKKAFKDGFTLRGNATKGKAGPFCGRSCGAIYGRKVQLGQIKPLPVQNYVESLFYFYHKNNGQMIVFKGDIQDAIFEALLK